MTANLQKARDDKLRDEVFTEWLHAFNGYEPGCMEMAKAAFEAGWYGSRRATEEPCHCLEDDCPRQHAPAEPIPGWEPV